MDSHTLANMAKRGAFVRRPAADTEPKPYAGQNIHSIAEDVRARLNATDPRNGGKPDDSHPHGLQSLIDERRVLLALERIIDREGY